MNQRLRGTIEMATAMAILGTIGWVVVFSNQRVIELVFWRCAFGACALAPICAALGLFRAWPDWRVFLFAGLGGVAIVANWLLLFAAFSQASIAIATTVYSTQPFILFGLGVAFFSERLTWAKLSWLALAFAGVALIVQGGPHVSYAGGDYVVGLAMAFGAAVCYALAATVAKRLKGTPPLLITLVQVVVGALMLAPFVEFSRAPNDIAGWTALAALGFIYTGALFSLQYAAIQKLPTHLIGSLYFVYPLVAIVVDVFGFGHQLTLIQVSGALAVLAGAVGANLVGTARTVGLRRRRTAETGAKQSNAGANRRGASAEPPRSAT